MQFAINDSTKTKRLRDMAVTVPKSIYSSSVISKSLELEKFSVKECVGEIELTNLWSQQNPLIIGWLVFSLVAIVFLFPLLVAIH